MPRWSRLPHLALSHLCHTSSFCTECSEYVTSVVLGTDMVARMSVHAMSRLREELLDCIGEYPVLSCPVLSCPVLSCPVLSCPVLYCPVLPCPVLSCPVLSLLFLIPKSLVCCTLFVTLTLSPGTDIIFFPDVFPPLTSLYLYLYLYLFIHACHCISE
jgi:hypothetical protein